MSDENQYSNRLPSAAAFENIPGKKTVRLVCHCPESKFIVGPNGCNELSAVRWVSSKTGKPIYIDGKGYLYYDGMQNPGGFCIMDCKFQCSETKAYNAFKNINDLRKTIKILDVTLANTNEVNVDAEHADILDDWVSQMYDIIKSRARAAR